MKRVQPSQSDVDGPKRMNAFQGLWSRLKEHPLLRIGPGLITGVADDDPSGIATYSQAVAYALSQATGGKWGRERKAADARGFYGVIAVSVLAGLASGGWHYQSIGCTQWTH